MVGCCKICKCQKEDDDGMKDINRNRSCTDILFCFAFLGFLVVTGIVAILGLTKGNVESLFYGSNSVGMTCGSLNNNHLPKVDMTAKKYVVYPRLQEDMIKQADLNPVTDLQKYTFFGICVKECPKSGAWVCTEQGEADIKTKGKAYLDTCRSLAGGGAFASAYNGFPTANADCKNLLKECYLQMFDTEDIFFRCINKYPKGTESETKACIDPPGISWSSASCQKVSSNITLIGSISTNKADLVAKQISDAISTALRLFGDVQKAYVVIFLVGALGAIAMGILFLVLMRYTAKCIVWGFVWLALLSAIGFTLICWVKAGMVDASIMTSYAESAELTSTLSASNANETENWKILAYISSALTLIFLLIIVFFWRKISLASAIISEASKAIASMPLIMLFPVNTAVILVVVFAGWLLIMGNLWTMSNVTTTDLTAASGASIVTNATVIDEQLKSVAPDALKNYLLAFHVFAGLWIMNFILGVSTLTICGAFAAWYWTEASKELVEKQKCKIFCGGCKESYRPRVANDKHPVFAAFQRTVRYHLGSVAFGSLVIAIVQFVRLCLEYLNQKTAGLQKKNLVLKLVFCCVRCCLWCFEKCVKYVTRSAYIIIATQGKSFCPACCAVFGLLTKHTSTLGITGAVSMFIIVLGKVVITAGCGIIAYFWLENDPTYSAGEMKLESNVLPLIFVAILAYMVGTLFLSVYDMGIDTIMISFCIDSDENKEGQYMYPESLAKAIGKGSQTRKAKLELGDQEKTTTSSYAVEPEKPAPSSGEFI
eukprot:Stramenopile-MAST_4_protein_4392